MKKILLVVLALLVVGGGVAVWFIGSPQGPRREDLAHLEKPRITTIAPKKVLLVEVKGDPKVTSKQAFGQLMSAYFKLDGVPRGGPDFPAPRARWPVDPKTPASEWVGHFALPVPASVTALPAGTTGVTLGQWEYGEVAEVLHVGRYDRETPTIDALHAFITASGYEIAGDHEEEYVRGPGMLFAGDPDTYLTVIRYAVRKRPAAE